MPGVLARSLKLLLRAIVRPSLGLQVISVAVLMAVLGGGVVGLVVTHSARSALRDTILNNSLATADLAAVLSATYMSDAQAAVRELAGEPTLGAAVRDGDVRELNLDLERWSVQHPNITVVLNDPDGIVLALSNADKTSLGQKRNSVDWVQAIATGQPYLATPGLSTTSKTPRIQYGVPVADETGVIRGALTASIELEALSSVITSINLGQNTRASLTDRQTGLILAHPDPSRILTSGSGKNLASASMVAGERGVLEDTSSSGQRVLAAFGPVPGLPWGILIQQPSDDAFAPLDEMDRNVMRLVGATMVLAIALGAMLALRIGRPLQRLRATAEAMASGDLDRRAGLGRQDEAGELGRAFDHMADRLQASIRRANESEAGIRAVMDSVADAIVTFDENGSIDSCNLAAERLFGYAAGGLIGQSIGRLVPEADVNKTESTWFAKVLSGEAAVSAGHECEGRRQDGASLPLEFTATPLVEDQRVAGVVVAFRDVSARQRAEASLRESEERLRLALEIDGLGTFDWDIQHDRVVWSEDLERMFGVEPGTFGDTLAAFVAFIHKDDLPAVTLAIADSLERDMALRVEVRFCHIDGTERWIRASGKVFRDPEGRPVRLLGVTRDVTERKQAEQQREAIAKLEKLRALGQMASGIAHDLNQSLMLVASYSDLARKELVQDPPNLAEIEELLTTATQAALDGGETVKRLLLFTRSAPEQDSQVVDLSSVVRDAARLTAPRWRDAAQAEGRPISLHIEAEGHPTAQGSPAQLRELMTNLIFNAVDALPTGGTIRLRVMAEDGQGVIDVTDSGIGMSAEVQARVFEPFFTTKGEGGTGLGLAMVFGIVEQHGGHIKVRSAPGEGTAFRISFPLVNASRQAEPPPTLPVQSELLLPLRILVVDDEPMMTKAVFRMLKPSGHVVSAAGSGEEALQKLTEQSFDVVVSDMAMGPGMNGWELADAVRRAWPNVRFLLATGWGAAMDPREARTRGVEAVLSKPYQLADLLRVLARPDKAA